MSITHHDVVRCRCGTEIEVFVADSLNAARHPHLRRMVLERQLHVFTCAACGHRFTVEKELLYFDFTRRQFIGVFPHEARVRERAAGEQVLEAYATAMQREAPAFVQEAARDFLVRACFGYEELREKLVADEAGLSDLVLEVLKLQLLAVDGWYVDHGVLTLRLDQVAEEGSLVLLPEWLGPPPEGVQRAPIVVERALYDRLLAHHDELVATRRDLASGPHCSLLRLIDWSARSASQT
jgi:hypothetical protein